MRLGNQDTEGEKSNKKTTTLFRELKKKAQSRSDKDHAQKPLANKDPRMTADA